MTQVQLALLRVLSCTAALMFASDWLLLRSELKTEDSTLSEGVAARSTFKGVPVTYISRTSVGEVRVPCSDAEALCLVPRNSDVKVWLERPAFFHDYWVVAAEYKGRRIIDPEQQRSRYRFAKFMWGFGTLAAILVAVALVKFPPDVENPANES
jgi:hypothetical protein